MKRHLHQIIAVVLTAFGVLTLFLSSSVLFDLFGMRAREGHFVPFVVWANFLCSLVYLAAAYGLYRMERWPVRLLWSAAGLLGLAFIGLLLHIAAAGAYETRTVFALPFRIAVTLVFAAAANWVFKNKGSYR